MAHQVFHVEDVIIVQGKLVVAALAVFFLFVHAFFFVFAIVTPLIEQWGIRVVHYLLAEGPNLLKVFKEVLDVDILLFIFILIVVAVSFA